MGWTYYEDDEIAIRGTSNGYVTLIVADDAEDFLAVVDIYSADRLRQLSKAFLDAIEVLESTKKPNNNFTWDGT
jgi:hypothetical protein